LKEKINNFKTNYDIEIDYTRRQFHDIHMSSVEKEGLVVRLFGLLAQQEKMLLYVKHLLKINKMGRVSIEDFQIRRNEVEENKELVMLRTKTTNLRDSYADLTNNFEDLKVLNATTIKKWATAELKTRELDNEIVVMKEKHILYVKKLKDDFKIKELQLIHEKEDLDANYGKYENDLKRELKIREELVNRYSRYNDKLVKEMTLVKNTIKNPKIMTDAMRKYNFNELNLYKYNS
jgi:hypothetical protein